MSADAPLADAGFVLVIGPSGVGKNTLIGAAVERDARLGFVPSMTTREMRAGEEEGRPYFFRSPEAFTGMIAAGEMLEWNLIHGRHYGTARRPVLERIARGHDAITDIEVVGAHAVLLALPLLVCAVFVLPPSFDVLRERILGRNPEDEDVVRRRLHRAELELRSVTAFDYAIVNDDFDRALGDLHAVVRAHRRRLGLLAASIAEGGEPAFRTVRFTIAPSPERPDGLALPKTRLGPTESYADALRRTLVLDALRETKGADAIRTLPEGLRIVEATETLHRRETPLRHVEHEVHCVVEAGAPTG